MNSFITFLFLVVDLPQERNNTLIDEETEYNLPEDWGQVNEDLGKFVDLLHTWFRRNKFTKPNVVVFGNVTQVAKLLLAFNINGFRADMFVWVKSNRTTVQLSPDRILHYHEEFVLIRKLTPNMNNTQYTKKVLKTLGATYVFPIFKL